MHISLLHSNLALMTMMLWLYAYFYFLKNTNTFNCIDNVISIRTYHDRLTNILHDDWNEFLSFTAKEM